MPRNNYWEEEIDYLKSILVQTELVETTKWGGPVYTINGKNVLGAGGFKDYFGLWFFNGVFLEDKHNLLINAQEDVTKALRQMRFTSKDEVNEKIVLDYVHEAIENEKKGVKLKPSKKKTIHSQLLDNALNSDPELKKEFQNFTPFKQREFTEYIESAKMEKTKLSRLEKSRGMILNGIGLNDKYRKS
jgi:uncharacterized protein YdeI (YjbR/CyaY-like superfamily)